VPLLAATQECSQDVLAARVRPIQPVNL
jgi:hypothetical protein